MRDSSVGLAVAVLVAGVPLWHQVQSGNLGGDVALLRVGLLAVACTAGAAGVRSVLDAFARTPVRVVPPSVPGDHQHRTTGAADTAGYPSVTSDPARPTDR